MPIELSAGPADALDIFIAGLANFDAFRDDAPGLITFPLATGDSPLPLLVMDAEPVNLRNKSREAFVWRYVFDLDGTPMLADLRVEENRAVFTSLTDGKVAERFKETLMAIDEFVEERAESYSLQVVEVPLLNEIAIWIHNPEHDFVFDVMRAGPPRLTT